MHREHLSTFTGSNAISRKGAFRAGAMLIVYPASRSSPHKLVNKVSQTTSEIINLGPQQLATSSAVFLEKCVFSRV